MHLLFLFCFFSSWHCRNYDAMLNLINTWAPILPQWITDNIKQQLILPRLQVSSNMKSRHTQYLNLLLWVGMCAAKGYGFLSRFRLKECMICAFWSLTKYVFLEESY